ncbi:MAG TPA: hypothetical protein VKZ63_21600, partial [Kofleriaceae bacterium]|nr:hypothetical protein [Kofleriaceae bacterium]
MRIRTLLALSLTAGGAAACSGGEEACDPEAPGTICTIAGNGASANERGSAGDGGLAYDARFDQVMDMAIAPNGELWILDYNTYLVRAIGPDGIIRSVVGDGSGLVGDGPPPGELVPADSVSFNHMSDMAFHDGYLYLSGFHNSRVLRVELDTMLAENVAGDGNRLYYYGDEGPALQAALDLPSGIAFDPDGNLTIVDQANQ